MTGVCGKIDGMTSTVVSSFGSALRRRRTEQNISVRRLAFRSGLTPATISALETERVAAPNLITAWKLAGALGIPLQDLISDIEEELPPC